MKNIFISVGLVVLILFAACKKESSSPEPILSEPNQPNLDAFFAANATAAQTFTFDAAQTQLLIGFKGTKITVPTSAFITKTGNIVSGNVELSLTEIYSKKEMILSKAQTMTSSDQLISGGEMKIVVKQNGQELKLYPGKKLYIKTPAGTSPYSNMKVYYGTHDFTTNQLTWGLALNNNLAPAVPDTTNIINPYYYSFASDSLNWVNCDQLYTSPGPKTSFTITVHGNYNSTNTNIFLVFPSIRGMAYLYPYTSQAYYNSYQLPIGINATIVAISKINGKFYASYTNTTITLNHLQDINLSETTEADILTKLGTL
jgi:hypothetical protein